MQRQVDRRVDVRFPEDVYRAIETVAEQDGAKSHHRSKKTILTPTIVRLVTLGLNSLSDKYPIDLSDNSISNDINDFKTSIAGEISVLRQAVSDLSDKISEIQTDKASNLSDISKESSDKLPIVKTSDESTGGLSSRGLAKELGVSKSTVDRWRTGKCCPSGRNADLFDRWEVKNDRWYQKTSRSC